MHIVDICRAKSVNALGIVSDDHDVVMAGTKEAYKFRLDACAVLILVDENPLVLSPEPFSSLRMFHQETMNHEQEVVIVESLLRPFCIGKQTV